MINLNYFKSKKSFKVGKVGVKEGEPILKIIMEERDLHKSRDNKIHLDIWGDKLETLKNMLR